MKKGCIVAVVVLMVLVAVGYLGIKKVVTHFKGVIDTFEKIEQEITTQTKELNARYPFEQPVDLFLTEAQTVSYLQVRVQINEVIKNTDFYRQIKKLEAMEETNEEPSFRDIVRMFSSLSSSIEEIYHQFFALLDQHQLSPEEYSYISDVVIGALSWELDKGNFKEEISPEFSLDLRKMMLEEEQADGPKFQVKNRLQQMVAADYEKLLQTIEPHVSQLDSVKDTFLFDSFTTMLRGENISRPNSHKSRTHYHQRRK